MNNLVGLILAEQGAEAAHEASHTPPWIACLPFVTLLMCIALLPLIRQKQHWG